MREFYQQMEFHSLLKDWLPELESRQHDYSELPAGADFPSTQEGPVAVAVSTYEAEAFLAVSARPGEARTLPVARLPELRAWLEDPARPKSVHDAKTTLVALRRHEIELRGVEHDTMLYSFLLDPTETGYELEKLAERHLDRKL